VRFADAVIKNRNFFNGRGLFSFILGYMQRAPYRAIYPKIKNDIAFDTERCTRCLRCSKICPVNNISTGSDGIPKAEGNCVLCVRCYNFCPTQAVSYMGKLHKAKREKPYQGPTVGFMPERLKE